MAIVHVLAVRRHRRRREAVQCCDATDLHHLVFGQFAADRERLGAAFQAKDQRLRQAAVEKLLRCQPHAFGAEPQRRAGRNQAAIDDQDVVAVLAVGLHIARQRRVHHHRAGAQAIRIDEAAGGGRRDVELHALVAAFDLVAQTDLGTHRFRQVGQPLASLLFTAAMHQAQAAAVAGEQLRHDQGDRARVADHRVPVVPLACPSGSMANLVRRDADGGPGVERATPRQHAAFAPPRPRTRLSEIPKN